MLLEKRKLRRYSGHPFLKTTMNFSLTICAFEIRVVGCFGLHSFKNKSFEGISDSEMDYFSVPRRSCESFPAQQLAIRTEMPALFAQKFFERLLYLVSRCTSFKANGKENSNFHNFLLEVTNNPYTFLNLRNL